MTPYLTDKDQRVLLVPMELPSDRFSETDTFMGVEPDDAGIFHAIYIDSDDGIKYGRPIIEPVRVGDRVPVREEWCRVCYSGAYPPSSPHPPYATRSTYKYIWQHWTVRFGDWQPASTMPDFAVRYWRRATKVDGGELVEGEPGHEFREWLWEIHVEPEEGE